MGTSGPRAATAATTVLLQGGLNPALPLEFYLALVRTVRERFPDVTPHFFTAPEIQQMVGCERHRPSREVLGALKDAGQLTLPGGGAEMLSESRAASRI